VPGTRQEIDLRMTSLAPPGAVYALLVDGASWPRWSPFRRFRTVPPMSFLLAGGDPDGVGAVRAFLGPTQYGMVRHRQRIEERVPDRRFSYTTAADMPVLDWRTDIDLEPSPDGGTRIRCHVTYTPQSRAATRNVRRELEYLYRRLVTGLALHAGT
jgi:uncharacterized protein YndB with AHSA1/START domain